MTPEGKVKKEISAALALQAPDLSFFMPEHMGLGKSGVSDYIGTFIGTGFAIEAKRAETEGPNVEYATPWQWRFLCDWRRAGGLTGVARSANDVERILSAHPRDQGPIDPLQPHRELVYSS